MIIFLWILLLLSACCCCIPLRYLLSHEWPRLRQMLYFPLSGQMRWEHRTQRTRLLRRLNGVEVTLTTADDRVVHAVWVPAPARAPAGACRMPSAMPSATPPAPCVPPRPLTRAPDCPRRRSLWARERSRQHGKRQRRGRQRQGEWQRGAGCAAAARERDGARRHERLGAVLPLTRRLRPHSHLLGLPGSR